MRALLLSMVMVMTGCISAPEIVMVDRATALEEQASGSYSDLETRLFRAGMSPTPVAITPDQIEALGIKPTPLVDNLDATPADKLDELIRRHCVGEAKDGLLTDSHQCKRALSASDATLMERANQGRLHLFKWMKDRSPTKTDQELRSTWRKVHLEGVICGGWIEADDGTWSEKKC